VKKLFTTSALLASVFKGESTENTLRKLDANRVEDIPFYDFDTDTFSNGAELTELFGLLISDSVFIGRLENYRYFSRSHGNSRDEISRVLFLNGYLMQYFKEDKKSSIFFARRSALGPPISRRKSLDVIVTAYNEESSVVNVVNSILNKRIEDLDINVIIVEGNSTDGTREKVLVFKNNSRVRLILEDRPQGKGYAVRLGLAKVSSDFVLIQDSDTEYDVDDYDKLLKPLMDSTVSFVLGTRQKSLNAKLGVRHFQDAVLVSRIANIANHFFRLLFNVTYHTTLRDPFTMFKVFRADCIYGLTFSANRFDFDWEILGKLIRLGYSPLEVPVSYDSRSFGEGKKIRPFRDPPTWVAACIKYRFQKLY
jgi:hypothetical protein